MNTESQPEYWEGAENPFLNNPQKIIDAMMTLLRAKIMPLDIARLGGQIEIDPQKHPRSTWRQRI